MIHFKSFILIIMLALLAPCAAMSQSTLVKLTDSLEDAKNVKGVIYQEKRSRTNHSISECKRTFTFTDTSIANRIIQAFKKERHNSVGYEVKQLDDNTFYGIYFNDGRQKTRFILLKTGSQWTYLYEVIPANKAWNKRNIFTSGAPLPRPGTSRTTRTTTSVVNGKATTRTVVTYIDDHGCKVTVDPADASTLADATYDLLMES